MSDRVPDPARSVPAVPAPVPRVTESRYREMVRYAFLQNWTAGATVVSVTKKDLLDAAEAMGFKDTVNPGDAIYDARNRSGLHKDVLNKTPPGTLWVILGAGRGKYRFVALDPSLTDIRPATGRELVKIPDSTPELIRRYAKDDEQALLARLLYNRLLDVFLGITCYRLQSHLRTTVDDVGQIEVDELYVGVSEHGATFVMPTEAKVGRENISVVQAWQGIALAEQEYKGLIARPVAAKFLGDRETIAMFEFAAGDPVPVVRKERHFRLVPAASIDDDELMAYRAAYEAGGA